MHAVPEFFNNDLVTPASIMKDYPIRYQSLAVNYFTLNTRLYNSGWVNTDDAVYTPNGEWVTVYLPGDPRLPAAEAAQVRAMAARLHYNVIQMPPPPTGPLATRIPYPSIALRQKAISSSFPYSNLALPCWSQNHELQDLDQPDQPGVLRQVRLQPQEQRAVLHRRREADLRAVHQPVLEEFMSRFPK